VQWMDRNRRSEINERRKLKIYPIKKKMKE
jgi:hypothetical protein